MLNKLLAAGAATSAALAAAVLAGEPEEAMLAADRAFAAMAAEKGVPAAFAAFAAEDVRMFPDGGEPYQGRGAMIARFQDWPEGATLKWAPEEAVAASGGDFGFTWGRYVYKGPDGDGGTETDHGKYVSIWRLEADRSWKFIVDIGNSNPAPDAASEE
ncbi:MAG: YybH family protein [Parvularculaceae bacterium]